MMPQMLIRTIDVICGKRASMASLLPLRPKHEVVDNKLAASGKEICQRYLSAFAFEDILLLHLLPGQLAQLLGHRFARMGELFLFRQKFPTCLHPLLVRHHFVTYCFCCRHCELSSPLGSLHLISPPSVGRWGSVTPSAVLRGFGKRLLQRRTPRPTSGWARPRRRSCHASST